MSIATGLTRRAPRRAVPVGWVLIIPMLVFLALFFVWPLVQMAQVSVRGGTATYADLWSTPVYRTVLGTTLWTAALVTLICLALGFPYAYVMYRSSPRVRTLLIAVVLLPFWSSLLVRSFAWIALLQDSGVVNTLLLRLGLVDEPVALIRTQLGVLIGMVHIMLPFMVLPLYAVMVRIDDRLLLAASSLGASPWRRFVRVFAPLSGSGVAAGVLLVFTITLGFYITPALLGGPRQTMLGEVIADRVSQFAMPTASALAMTLLAGTLVLLGAVAFALARGRTRTS